MTEIRINNPIERGFAMVPDVLWQWPGLSFKAKGFMAFLLSFRGGNIPPVAAIEEMTGLGRNVRRACMAELQAAGLAEWKVQHGAGGRVVAKFLLVDTGPLLRAVASGQVHRAPEKPSDGEATMRPKNRLTVKAGGGAPKKGRIPPRFGGDLIEKERESAASPAAPQRAERAQAAPSDVVKSAREAEGAAPGEASKEAENERGAAARAVLARLTEGQRLEVRAARWPVMIDGREWSISDLSDIRHQLRLQEFAEAAGRRAAAGRA